MLEHPNRELVSIVMPAYRAESIIGDSLASAIGQTYPAWELLVADDCSPDRTADIVASAAADDPRIVLLRGKENQGPAQARNRALNHAKGRWIAFLDSDDVWLPDKLERSLEFAKSLRAALVFTGFRRMSDDGKTVGSYQAVPDKLAYNDLLGNTSIATSSVLIDRELAGDFRMKNVYYDDFACWLEILKRGELARGLNLDLMRYRVVKGSVSRNKLRSAKEVWKAYREIENLNLVTSMISFVRYATNAYLKYRKF